MPGLLRRVWSLAKPYWVSSDRYRAFALLAILWVFGFLIVRIQVSANDLTRQFYDALQQYQPKAAIHFALLYVLMVTAFATVVALSAYVGNTLVNRWRRWLTQHYLDKWLDHQAYYRMPLCGMVVDNPDQRIADDIDSFTSSTLSLFNGFYATFIQLITFTVVLWHLSGTFHFHLAHWPVAVPGYLVWCALFYSVLSTMVTLWVGRQLRRLNYQQQHYTADFRFGLVRLRENAESIALMQGTHAQKRRLMDSYGPIYRNFSRLILVGSQMTLFNKAVDYISMMLGTLFALPKFMVEKMSVGDLMQIASAFSYVVNGLCYFMNAYGEIAAWRAVVDRLTEFSRQTLAADQRAQANWQVQASKDVDLHIKQLRVRTPTGSILIDGLNQTICAGERLLIMGPFGCGKSTLLRCIAGLWPFAEGCIEKPTGRWWFLPQKPYFPIGTLKAALHFPDLDFDDKSLETVLGLLNLQHFLPLLPQEAHWMQRLSLGEQQMLNFARAIMAKPNWLFLDEASSSLDEANEAFVYQVLIQALPHTTIVSVGHRSSLLAHHGRVIHLSSE